MYNISKVIYEIEQLSECAKYFYDKKTLKPQHRNGFILFLIEELQQNDLFAGTIFKKGSANTRTKQKFVLMTQNSPILCNKQFIIELL